MVKSNSRVSGHHNLGEEPALSSAAAPKPSDFRDIDGVRERLLLKSGMYCVWLVALLAIILLAFTLRMAQIGQLRMWGDEGFSVYSANRDLVSISFASQAVDPHPPLYYYLLHFYLPLAGFSELSIRYFSVFFGTATVALLFAIGKRMFAPRVGVLAAALAALAPFGVQYSQEVRMYALVMFLGALALWFFWRIANCELGIADSSSSRLSPFATRHLLWLGFFVSMLLTQYSLYQSAFLFVAQGIFWLPFLKRHFSFVARWLAVSIGIVILFLPWLLTHSDSALTDVQGVAGNTAPMNLLTFLERGFAAIAVGPTIPFSVAFTPAALFAAVIALGLIIALATRTARVNDWLLVAFVVVPMASLYPIYFLAPLYRGRLFAVAFVPLLLLLARGVMLITSRARWAAPPIALLLVGVSAYSLNNYYFHYDRYSASVEDYIPAIQDIEQRAQPGDVVLFHAYWQEGYFLSHYHGAALTYGALDQRKDLVNAVSQPRNVWAIVQALPVHGSESWLAQNAFPLGEKDFGQMRVLAYRAGVPPRGETFAAPVVFENGVRLLGYHLNAAPIESGRGIVTLQLDWQAAQKIADDYTVSVRLTDATGETIWAQADSPPSSGTQPTTAWQPGQTIIDHHALSVPVGTPPGAYAIQIVLYDPKTSRAANIVAPENRRGQSVMLGTVDAIRPRVPVAAPTIANALDAQWNEIALVGADRVAEQVAAGDSLALTLYWQARQPTATDYLAVLQVVGSDGKAGPAVRHLLVNPDFPTPAWAPNETWRDKINLPIPAETAAGNATVLIGLIDAQSEQPIALHATSRQARGTNLALAQVRITK